MTKEIYTAALIIIGDEILSGRTHDSNTPWIAENLNEIGVRLYEVRVIPDDRQKIIKTVNEMRKAHDYVFTTGGIGPTHDDITAESIAAAFGVELELNDAAYGELLAYYKNESEITPSRKKMAMIPKGATLVDNPVSGAPGIKIENVYVFAGVPRIMQAMFDAIKHTLTGGKPVETRSVSCNLAESIVADGLAEIQSRYAEISIGSYPKYQNGKFGTALVLRGIDEEALAKATQEVADLVISLGEDHPIIA
ncbi:MAG: competence/damage-inducible protein A [Alphaproteobacteria bacterium]|nr:competence/damage-inducible protein A [Alphaproteobacteria bacterium]NCQ89034.1 competence/damage-inducible protein A [Alphaproteobacteria bacterium]NCT07934.1 competence/damage-inducible protein A [Alphaproteobacteria bacterium]